MVNDPAHGGAGIRLVTLFEEVLPAQKQPGKTSERSTPFSAMNQGT